MNRLKITWKWNGKKIREESGKDYTEEIDGQEMTVTSRKAGPPAIVAPENETYKRFEGTIFKYRDTDGTMKLAKMVPRLPVPKRAQPVGFIFYTNLIYQLLEGEVMNG